MYHGEIRVILYERKDNSSLVWIASQVKARPIEWVSLAMMFFSIYHKPLLGKGQGPDKRAGWQEMA